MQIEKIHEETIASAQKLRRANRTDGHRNLWEGVSRRYVLSGKNNCAEQICLLWGPP
jgi:hypothetical protein